MSFSLALPALSLPLAQQEVAIAALLVGLVVGTVLRALFLTVFLRAGFAATNKVLGESAIPEASFGHTFVTALLAALVSGLLSFVLQVTLQPSQTITLVASLVGFAVLAVFIHKRHGASPKAATLATLFAFLIALLVGAIVVGLFVAMGGFGK